MRGPNCNGGHNCNATISVTHGHSLYAFIPSVLYLWYLAYLLELWCLDSRLSGIMLPRFHDSSFIYDVWHSAFWNYVASIPCSLFHFRYRYLNSAFPILELCCLDSMFLFFHGMCILELCRLDSIITDILRTVFEIQRIYYTVIMFPRFHRVRTRRPGNSL